ncbi:hypothetical protein CYMTET_39467 [Cymbomonas tetramitiformis]|uniref:Uncharacterized protein n=1 Tax=Cymbomonas tetramitiformis TaxID=36881 RepID=A0AAE0CB17_9CHLO|nr:hypothetical protein CYMTET_39467 [Cymbomonas tetramitiformis]
MLVADYFSSDGGSDLDSAPTLRPVHLDMQSFSSGGGIRITKEPKIQPSQRLKEFPNHCLRISGGKLFCSCCKEELSLLKQSVKTHVSSAKHSLAKDKYVQQRQDDAHITDVLTEYFTEHNDEATAGLEPEVHLYRYRVTESLLFAGVPISKGDYLRPLLERADIKLTGSEHLRQYVPKIESLEFEHLHHELQGQSVFFILEQKKIRKNIGAFSKWEEKYRCFLEKFLKKI